MSQTQIIWQLCGKFNTLNKLDILAEYETKKEAIDVLATISEKLSATAINDGTVTFDDIDNMTMLVMQN
jgi:sensor histidine kinase YesM